MDAKDSTTKTLIALQYVEELSYKKKANLISAVENISDLSLSAFRKTVISVLGDEHASQFFCNLQKIGDIIDDMQRVGVHWLSYLDDDYPDGLRGIYDPPHILFFKGSVDAIRADGIAVVGTRRPTRYGAKVAQEFSGEFAKAGAVVISGLARGIDSIAHKACVDNKCATVAVFACGLDVCYPAEHRGLVDAILENGGAIVSEYALGTKPLQYHFPERNRIVSGLSRAVFLPQAASKSGSLITMRLAIEQGKDIFVVPGNIYDEESRGGNLLLRDMPHALAIQPEDVLDALHISREVVQKQEIELSLTENLILEELRDEEKHFEELLDKSGLSVSELTGILFDMELNGLVEKTAGNYYTLA